MMAFKIMSFKEFTDMKNAQEAPEEPEVAETPDEMPKTSFVDFIKNRKSETKFDIRSSDEIEEFRGCEPETEECAEGDECPECSKQNFEDVESVDELVSDECSDCEPEDLGNNKDADPETDESVESDESAEGEECVESAECPEQDCDEHPDTHDNDIVEVDFTGI